MHVILEVVISGLPDVRSGKFFIALTANVGRQASLGAWNIVLLVLVLVLVLVSVLPSRSSK